MEKGETGQSFLTGRRQYVTVQVDSSDWGRCTVGRTPGQCYGADVNSTINDYPGVIKSVLKLFA